MSKFTDIYDAISEIDAVLDLQIIPELETKFEAILPAIEELLADVRSTVDDRVSA